MKKILPIIGDHVRRGVASGTRATSEAPPASAAEFYKKNVVTMVIGFNPGAAVTTRPIARQLLVCGYRWRRDDR